MKNLAIAFCAIILMSSSCKPTIDDVPEDLLMQILTEGEWTVTEYKFNSDDQTQSFAGWRFKYYKNKTVDAKYNGSVMTTGTWDGSQSSGTFSNNFSLTTHPIPLVNGPWTVITPGTRTVTASQTSGSDVKSLKLYRE